MNTLQQSFQDLGSSILGLSILDPDGKSHYDQHVFISQFLPRDKSVPKRGLRSLMTLQYQIELQPEVQVHIVLLLNKQSNRRKKFAKLPPSLIGRLLDQNFYSQLCSSQRESFMSGSLTLTITLENYFGKYDMVLSNLHSHYKRFGYMLENGAWCLFLKTCCHC